MRLRSEVRRRSRYPFAIVPFVVVAVSFAAAPVHAEALYTAAGTISTGFAGTGGTVMGPIVGEFQDEPIAGVLECVVAVSGTLPSLQNPTAPFDGTAECARTSPGAGGPGPWEIEFLGTLTGTVVQVTGSFGEPDGPSEPLECAGQITPTNVNLTQGELQVACVIGPILGSIVVGDPLP